MRIALYVLAGWQVLNALFVIGLIGKPRKPITPGGAIGVVIAVAASVYLLMVAAGHLR